MGYEDNMSPEMRERYLKLLNDPDLLSLKKEIKLTEGLIAKLPAGSKERAALEKTLAKLQKTQAKLDKPPKAKRKK